MKSREGDEHVGELLLHLIELERGRDGVRGAAAERPWSQTGGQRARRSTFGGSGPSRASGARNAQIAVIGKVRDPAVPFRRAGHDAPPFYWQTVRRMLISRSVSTVSGSPCGVGGGVELAGAADLLERARGAHHAVGVEVGGGALQPVGRAAQRLAVARVERLPDLLQVPRRIVDEQPADFGEQLAVAADAREHVRRARPSRLGARPRGRRCRRPSARRARTGGADRAAW